MKNKLDSLLFHNANKLAWLFVSERKQIALMADEKPPVRFSHRLFAINRSEMRITMLGLPKTTEMSKQLPKKAIYAKFQMNTAAKEKIDADISRITIIGEIAPNKVNIPAGDEVKNFFVLLVSLKRKEFDEKTIATLSKLIPQNILFILEYGSESKLAIYHTKIMQTDWKPTGEQRIELQGLNLDKVWENVVVAVGGVDIKQGNTLNEQIEVDEKRQKLEKEIAKFEKQARTEKQPKKKFELVQRLREYQGRLKLLNEENNQTK